MAEKQKTKLAPISKSRQIKLIKFTREISKALKNGSTYLNRTDIKIN